MRKTSTVQTEAANLILAILEKVDENPKFFAKAARKETISDNQLLAAAIAQAVWELLDAEGILGDGNAEACEL